MQREGGGRKEERGGERREGGGREERGERREGGERRKEGGRTVVYHLTVCSIPHLNLGEAASGEWERT